MQPSQRISPRRLVSLGTLFGGGLVAAAIFWTQGINGQNGREIWYPDRGILKELCLGSGSGLLGAALAWRLAQVSPAVKRLQDSLTGMINFDEMKPWHALMLGIAAGIPEEMFFRGAMQPELGLIITALLFGALHAISITYFLYASLAGLILGILAAWRDNLWAATAMHICYDTGLFLLMIWHTRQKQTIIES